jgi:hypothetical protein
MSKPAELSAEGFLRDWAKGSGPHAAAAKLVLMQIEDDKSEIERLTNAISEASPGDAEYWRELAGKAAKECLDVYRQRDEAIAAHNKLYDERKDVDAYAVSLEAVARKALSTLECGRAFAGLSVEEFADWCGHADLVEQELRAVLPENPRSFDRLREQLPPEAQERAAQRTKEMLMEPLTVELFKMLEHVEGVVHGAAYMEHHQPPYQAGPMTALLAAVHDVLAKASKILSSKPDNAQPIERNGLGQPIPPGYEVDRFGEVVPCEEQNHE